MNLLDRNIDKIKNLCDKHKVSKLYVFGSILTNQFSKSSDIDFVVDFKNVNLYNYADNYFDFNVASNGSLTLDGSNASDSLLTLGSGLGDYDAGLIFDGNALDYYLALDDTDDSFKIGTSSTIGSSTILTLLQNGSV